MYFNLTIQGDKKGWYLAMYFSYDLYKNIHEPEVYLAYGDKHILSQLKVHQLKISTRLNSISYGSLQIYKLEDGEPVPYYDKIQIGLLLEVRHISWFQITDIKLERTEGAEYLEISFQSLEIQLGQTYLTSFGSLGTSSDEQGGLDRYCLYNINDQEHSIMHIFQQKNPGWLIGSIDPGISTQYRAFYYDTISSYEFLTGAVSETYECIFQFDVYKRTVNVFKLDNIGEKTPIFLSDRNLIKSLTVNSDDSDIKSVFIVSGGNDSRTNTTLGIQEINPSGNNYISNFSYFYKQMSPELVSAIQAYNQQIEANSENFSNAITQLETLYTELETLKHHVPENHNTTDFSQYGLVELEEKRDSYKHIMSLYLNQTKNPAYSTNHELCQKAESEILLRKTQISAKESEIENQLRLSQTYLVNIQNFLGPELYKELSYYIREQDFQDDSFLVTSEMSQAEIYEMQKELLAHAHQELQKACYPKFEMSIQVLNFAIIEDFRKYTDKLELGNIITVEWEPGIFIEARILGMDMDFDNPDNFTLLISSKNSLTEKWALLAEIQNQATNTSTSVDYNKGGWNIAKDTSLDFKKWINHIFDASLQKLQNSANQEILMDETGMIIRKWLVDKNKYSPNQIWITNGQIAFTRDNWKSVCTVVGEITLPDQTIGYGIAGQYIIGEIISGESLILRGSCAQLDFETNNSFQKATTQIKANQGEILLRVKKNEVINEINISQEGIRIQGNRLILDGNVTFSNSNKFNIDGDKANITNINGGNIKTGTITTEQIKSGTITANNIKANTITSNKLCSDTGWAKFLDAIDFTTRYINCGNGFLTGSPSQVTLGDFEVYEFNGSTYLGAPKHNTMGIGVNNGACFYANWQDNDAFQGDGSASFQVNGQGELYASHIIVNKITARKNSSYSNKIIFEGLIDFSQAKVSGLSSNENAKYTKMLFTLAEIIDEQWNHYSGIAEALENSI